MSEIFSNDAEISLLAIILAKPESIYELSSIQPQMMSSSPHQLLFATIRDLSSQGFLPDATLVATHLESKGKLEESGGRDYIKYLLTQKAPTENLTKFEEIIVNGYKAKKLITYTSTIPELALQTDDVGALIAKLRNSLDDLSTIGGGEKTFSLASALPEVWGKLVERVKNPGIAGKTFGIQAVDLETAGICKGDYWVIAARPSMGKTAIIINSMLRTAKAGNGVLLFSREMNKQPIVERMLAVDSKLSISNMRIGNLGQEEMDKLSKTIESIKDLPIHIDTSFVTNTSYIESTIRKYVKTYNVDLVYIDYLQLLSERGEDATSELGRISRMIKLLANDLNIGIVVASQLNREVEYRDDKRPILSDMRQCGNIEEDADVVIGLYRDEHYNKNSPDKGIMEFILRKQRQGPTGTIRLKINLETNFITD